jgi:hypothetical protein
MSSVNGTEKTAQDGAVSILGFNLAEAFLILALAAGILAYAVLCCLDFYKTKKDKEREATRLRIRPPVPKEPDEPKRDSLALKPYSIITTSDVMQVPMAGSQHSGRLSVSSYHSGFYGPPRPLSDAGSIAHSVHSRPRSATLVNPVNPSNQYLLENGTVLELPASFSLGNATDIQGTQIYPINPQTALNRSTSQHRTSAGSRKSISSRKRKSSGHQRSASGGRRKSNGSTVSGHYVLHPNDPSYNDYLMYSSQLANFDHRVSMQSSVYDNTTNLDPNQGVLSSQFSQHAIDRPVIPSRNSSIPIGLQAFPGPNGGNYGSQSMLFQDPDQSSYYGYPVTKSPSQYSKSVSSVGSARMSAHDLGQELEYAPYNSQQFASYVDYTAHGPEHSFVNIQRPPHALQRYDQASMNPADRMMRQQYRNL